MQMPPGFPSILKGWKEESWAEPELTERQDLNEVHLMLKVNLSDDSSSNSSSKLSDKQQAILSYLKNNPFATRLEMAKNLDGMTFASIKYQVTQLGKLGYLGRKGSDKNGHWVVNVKKE